MNRTAAAFASLTLLACASAPPAKSGPETFQAKLDATNEVPPPSLSGTSPSGTATFKHEGNSIAYKVNVSGLSSPLTVAHIHVGAPGVAGPVVVPLALTPGPTEGTAVGEGSFDASSMVWIGAETMSAARSFATQSARCPVANSSSSSASNSMRFLSLSMITRLCGKA